MQSLPIIFNPNLSLNLLPFSQRTDEISEYLNIFFDLSVLGQVF